tara:strand:- start:332 stop:613 length:282 start_codon:yes stop_codon:yes gene_type:complete
MHGEEYKTGIQIVTHLKRYFEAYLCGVRRVFAPLLAKFMVAQGTISQNFCSEGTSWKVGACTMARFIEELERRDFDRVWHEGRMKASRAQGVV